MNAMDYLRIAPFINDCPNCGSDIINNGKGSLSVDTLIVKRTCACGFNFEYDVTNGTTKKKIKDAINIALAEIDTEKQNGVKA